MDEFNQTSDVVVSRMVSALQRLQIEFMLVGSLSVNAYATPRSTKDADIELLLSDGDLVRLQGEIDAEFEMSRQLEFELVTGSLRNICRHRKTDFEIELFRLSDDPHHQKRFQRRVTIHLSIFDQPVSIPTVEDVIIEKLRWNRPKDQVDVRNLIALHGEQLDRTYLDSWLKEHQTADLFEQLSCIDDG